MDCFGTYFTHAQSCNVTRVQSRATEWTASVHTSHMSKVVMQPVFKVLRNGQDVAQEKPASNISTPLYRNKQIQSKKHPLEDNCFSGNQLAVEVKTLKKTNPQQDEGICRINTPSLCGKTQRLSECMEYKMEQTTTTFHFRPGIFLWGTNPSLHSLSIEY